MKDYKKLNKEAWNIRTDVHLDSEFYANEVFISGKNSLNQIELDLLGDIKGKSILHLQCHFGQDSISLARLGASVTAVDLSDRSILRANELAEKVGVDVEFICSDLYDLPSILDKHYDIVFTSYGTIIWLPDLLKWSKLISHFLKKDGKFVFVDFHPFVQLFDDNVEKLTYDYFNTAAIVETESGTYAESESSIETEYVTWSHPLSDVLHNLSSQGLEMLDFQEYDYSPYPAFKALAKVGERKYQLKNVKTSVPLVFSLVYSKKYEP